MMLIIVIIIIIFITKVTFLSINVINIYYLFSSIPYSDYSSLPIKNQENTLEVY